MFTIKFVTSSGYIVEPVSKYEVFRHKDGTATLSFSSVGDDGGFPRKAFLIKNPDIAFITNQKGRTIDKVIAYENNPPSG